MSVEHKLIRQHSRPLFLIKNIARYLSVRKLFGVARNFPGGKKLRQRMDAEGTQRYLNIKKKGK